MAVSAAPYAAFLQGLPKGQFNFTTDTVKVALTSATYIPDMDADAFLSDVDAEITGTGYTAGGLTLTGLTVTYDDTQNWAVVNAASAVWTGASFTAHYAVVYKSTGSAATSPLIGFIDFGADKTYAGEDFTLSFAAGLVRLSAA